MIKTRICKNCKKEFLEDTEESAKCWSYVVDANICSDKCDNEYTEYIINKWKPVLDNPIGDNQQLTTVELYEAHEIPFILTKNSEA